MLSALLVIGCGGGPSGPTNEGALEVIASTTGSDLDPDGYTLSVDNGTPHPLPSNGADTLVSLSPGAHLVTLAGIAPNCLLDGENPRSVDIAAASTTTLRLDIACSEPQGRILVAAATTGQDLDLDGYQVAVEGGGVPQRIATNGSEGISFGGLTSGDHEVALSDVAPNCSVTGPNPRQVAVLAGVTAKVDFSVSCIAVPLTAPGHDIAFVGDDEVYLLSADGTTLANLTNNPSDDLEPAWSPDGQTIAFSSDRSGNREVYLMNADGSGQVQLTSSGGRSPAWSPDGSQIAFSTNEHELYVMKSDGSAITQITTSAGDTPAWSPDGTRIAFAGLTVFGFDIFVMNADGSGVTQLTTNPEPGDRSQEIDANPVWSPDGTKIAFDVDLNGEHHIHVMSSDGTGDTQLTFGDYYNSAPAWSPDGSKIAFASARTGISRLYMMNPDGTGQVPLTPNSYRASTPAWRP